jgi:hypothetical protein
MEITVVWQQQTKIKYKHFSEFLDYEQADQIGQEKGYGKTILIGFSLPFKRRIRKAIIDLIAGFNYHYPICCVLNFCLDTLLNRPCAQLRYSDNEYVECFLHIKKCGRKTVPENLY